jgi:hypothetical protein
MSDFRHILGNSRHDEGGLDMRGLRADSVEAGKSTVLARMAVGSLGKQASSCGVGSSRMTESAVSKRALVTVTVVILMFLVARAAFTSTALAASSPPTTPPSKPIWPVVPATSPSNLPPPRPMIFTPTNRGGIDQGIDEVCALSPGIDPQPIYEMTFSAILNCDQVSEVEVEVCPQMLHNGVYETLEGDCKTAGPTLTTNLSKGVTIDCDPDVLYKAWVWAWAEGYDPPSTDGASGSERCVQE